MAWFRDFTSRSVSNVAWGSEPLTDAQMYEPVPYRSAFVDNCTHVVALRTKPDDLSVTNPMPKLEKMISRRFFGRKMHMPHLMNWMLNQVCCC